MAQGELTISLIRFSEQTDLPDSEKIEIMSFLSVLPLVPQGARHQILFHPG
jgi:hypothetical protein